MRSWGSIYSMLPKGGAEIWNQYDHFLPPEDQEPLKDAALKPFEQKDEPVNETEAVSFAQFSDANALNTGEMMELLLGQVAISFCSTR